MTHRITRIAALALGLALAGPAAAQDTPIRMPVERDVDTLVHELAVDRNAEVAIEDDLKSCKVVIRTGSSFETIASLLSAIGIELVETAPKGGRILYAVPHKKLCTLAGSLEPRHLTENEPLPDGNWLVTKPYRPKHVDANGLQTAIRALMTRDPRRTGNIIYVQANESLLITDLAPAVREYERVLADLDRPAAGGEKTGNLRLDLEVWSVPAALADELRDKPEAAPAALRASKEATRLCALAGTGSTRAPKRAIDETLVLSGEQHPGDTTIEVSASPEGQPGRLGISFRLKYSRRGIKLDLPPRSVEMKPGEWSLVHVGDPGVAVLLRAREE